MIVLDASVVVELLTNGPAAASIKDDLEERADSFKVLSALRCLRRERTWERKYWRNSPTFPWNA